MREIDRLRGWLTRETSILPLVVLRGTFGLLMLVGSLRFVANGWVEAFYVEPGFHFTYAAFGWVQPLPAAGLYALFAMLALLSLCIALGLFYRASIAAFFVLFTYVELLDKTYYLNHYYFVSLLSFLLIWLPAGQAFSLDAWRRQRQSRGWVDASTAWRAWADHHQRVPMWTIAAVRLQVGLVYFFGGVAKLKPDWLLHAQPLQIWLAASTDFPLLGPLFDRTWLAYAMSWGGALFDLSIAFLLLHWRTRPLAYLAVVGFHVMTGMLFPIGLFPAIMIGCALVFFTAEDVARWRRWLVRAKQWVAARAAPRPRHAPPVAPFGESHLARAGDATYRQPSLALATLLTLFFLAQLVLPLRHHLYPGNVLWTEQGYRFAWHVMLAEKTGHVTFTVIDPSTGRRQTVYPSEHLSYQQEKQMSFQPDMIAQFAHHLAERARADDIENPAVHAEAFVSLNGRPSQLLIDPSVNLAAEPINLWPKAWVLPLDACSQATRPVRCAVAGELARFTR